MQCGVYRFTIMSEHATGILEIKNALDLSDIYDGDIGCLAECRDIDSTYERP